MAFKTDKKDHVAAIRKLYDLGYRRMTDSYGMEVILGEGSFGKVLLARRRFGEPRIAVGIKMMDMMYNSDGTPMSSNERWRERNNISREIYTHCNLSRLNHPNLVKQFAHYQIDHKVYIILEYCNSETVDNYIYDIFPHYNYRMKANQQRYWFRQMCQGIQCLHIYNIIHRDIKGANILVHRNPVTGSTTLKICDFGFAVHKPTGFENLAGTPVYLSPEIIKENLAQERGQDTNRVPLPIDGKAADIWALGVLFYEMTFGNEPFDVDHTRESTVSKMTDKVIWLVQHSSSQPAMELMSEGLLALDPKERLTIQQVTQHPWYKINDLAEPTIVHFSTRFPQV